MKGQIWSVDFILSLLIFIVAVLASYTLINNTLSETNFEDVQRQAKSVAEVLVSSGYPEHYNHSTVLRAGLLSDNRLSLRKARQLAHLNDTELHQALRVSDNFFVYFTNSSNETVPITGECGLGNLNPTSTEAYKLLPSVSFAAASAPVSQQIFATRYDNESVYNAMKRSDIIVLEGNITGLTSQTPEEVSSWMEQISAQGKTIFVLGYPGTSMLGIVQNATALDEINAAGTNGVSMNLSDGETLNVSVSGTIDVDRILPPAGTHVSNYRLIASEGTKPSIAEWVYKDTQVYYFATTDILKQDGRNFTYDIIEFVQTNINVTWPNCGAAEIPTNSEQVGKYQRTMLYHDSLLTTNILVWRYS